MEQLKSYIIHRQSEFDKANEFLKEKNIFVSIDSKSIDIENHLNSVLILLNNESYNAKQILNTIKIINDKYNISIDFNAVIKSNKIYCNVELKIKNYHVMCRKSISKDYIYEDCNIFNLSDMKLIDSIKNLLKNIDKNYIFCDCVR